MVFPVVMYGCDCLTIKKTEHWRIDAFELCCWRRLLRVPWSARRSNQSILKETSPEYSLAGELLKLQYFGHLMQRTDSLKKTQVLGSVRFGPSRILGYPQDGWRWQERWHRSYNELEPDGPGSNNKKVKKKEEIKRLMFLGLHRRPIKPLTWDLLCSQRPQAPSWWGEDAERLLHQAKMQRAFSIGS